ncbi:hypothetical protein GOP47_0021714 [Adiantum capillus-veneris]|uniref:Uncharacterized protein n=1 Tax=Adiantum capillus-veneris TaxID=13818 RepID=A0A9D4U8C2_ADICA|nr:hypothetical protein GOP47_0021714 [Adiantum capillus-veneris]
MASLNQTHNPSSSLSRSPTIQYRIDSLSRLEEGFGNDTTVEPELMQTSYGLVRMHIEEPHCFAKHQRGNHQKRHYYEHRDDWKPHVHAHSPRFTLRCIRTRGYKMRFLLPLVVVVVFPCFYYYAHTSLEPHNSLPLSLDKDNFDHIALVFFFSAVLVSIKVAYPRLNVICRIRAVFSQSRGRFTLTYLKPVIDYLDARKSGKKLLARASSVTWTIGSKNKCERSKHAKEGVQMYSNGDVYEGEFHQGRYSGSGVYYFYMSGRYEGDWVDGKYDGFGVETWTRGSRYRGQYRRGLREGYGVYRFYTGDVYSGEWLNGQSHGCGVQTCEDGSRFVGEFKWGVKHGFGYYHFRNGDTYAGEYFADKMHGYGVYQFANGHHYEGAWHEGKRQGLGIYAFRSGDVQAGYWHAGMLRTRSTHTPVTGATTAISHSKVLHAVQEARRASAKSHKVPHVDERVNKAVAAANRAANAARVAALKAVQSRAFNSAPP